MCLPHRAACRHTSCKRTDHPIIIHLKVGGACAARFFKLAHACIILHQMAACGHCMPDRTDRPIIECPQTPSLSICVLPITTFGHERKLGCPPAPPFFQWLASWQHVGKVKSAYVCKLGGSPSTPAFFKAVRALPHEAACGHCKVSATNRRILDFSQYCFIQSVAPTKMIE